jgi:outer membrane protein assembly factor BamB
VQINRNDVLESKVIESLVEKLQENPNNDELRKEIREYDLMARKAYFNSRWQVKTGSYLLLFAGIVLLVSLRINQSLTSKIEKPDEKSSDEKVNRILSQRWILFAAGGVMVLALAAGFLTQNTFNMYGTDQPNPETTANEMTPDEQNIEVIDITVGNTDQNAEEQSAQEAAGEELSTEDQVLEEEPAEPSDEELAQNENAVEESPKKTTFPAESEIENNFNSFRGAWGHGTSEHKNIPTDWDGASGKNIAWKVKIPKKGYNSPVLWNEKLFIAGGNESGLKVFCYNRNTGNLIWERDVNNIEGSPSTPPETTDDTGLSAPSVSTDGNHVIAIFGTGDIIAFDMQGNRQWARNLGVPDNHYGHSSSLIMLKEKVFVQFDTNKGGKLIALNNITGKTIWEIERDTQISWASPILAKVNGEYQVVLSSAPLVAGYDAETGKELWSNRCMMGEVGPSPAFGEGLVFATNEYASLVAIDPTTGETVWEDNEYMPEVASPVVSEGLLFIATTYGVFVCYDAKEGTKYWEQELNEGIYSSPIVADGKVYVSTMGGTTHIMEVSKEPTIINQPKLGEQIVTTPAFADGNIYFRGEENLVCIGK